MYRRTVRITQSLLAAQQFLNSLILESCGARLNNRLSNQQPQSKMAQAMATTDPRALSVRQQPQLEDKTVVNCLISSGPVGVIEM